jgi:hypothetical protein
MKTPMKAACQGRLCHVTHIDKSPCSPYPEGVLNAYAVSPLSSRSNRATGTSSRPPILMVGMSPALAARYDVSRLRPSFFARLGDAHY